MDRYSCQELWWIWDLTYLQVNKSPCHWVTKFLISKTWDRRFLDQRRRTVYYSQQQQHPEGRHFYSGPPGFISIWWCSDSLTRVKLTVKLAHLHTQWVAIQNRNLNLLHNYPSISMEDWFPDTLQMPKSADAWDPCIQPFMPPIPHWQIQRIACTREQACLLIALEGDTISIFKDSLSYKYPWKVSLEHLQAVQKHARSRNMQNPSKDFSRQEYWSGLPFPSPEDLPDPGTQTESPALQVNSLLYDPTTEAKSICLSKIVSQQVYILSTDWNFLNHLSPPLSV